MNVPKTKKICSVATVLALAGLSLGIIGTMSICYEKKDLKDKKGSYENKQPIIKVPSFYGFGAAIAAADINGDGLVDLLSAESSGDVFAYINNGKNQFVKGEKPILKVQSFYGFGPSISAADIDGDGLVDILSVDSEGNVYVHKNLGNSTFD